MRAVCLKRRSEGRPHEVWTANPQVKVVLEDIPAPQCLPGIKQGLFHLFKDMGIPPLGGCFGAFAANDPDGRGESGGRDPPDPIRHLGPNWPACGYRRTASNESADEGLPRIDFLVCKHDHETAVIG